MGGARQRIAVVGGGALGLACAAELAAAGHELYVLERRARTGEETSSRNSGVIHTGIHYPRGSLVARSCAEGRARLYERCARLGIPHRRTGKLVVAVSEDERDALDRIESNARDAGVHAIRRLAASELRAREPALRAIAALACEDAGIVDAAAYVASLRAEARSHGAAIVCSAEVVALERRGLSWRVHARVGDAAEHLEVDHVINAAGHFADRVAAMAGVDVDAAGWRQTWCKGTYFVLSPSAPRPRAALVYPVPPPAGGLGIHLTADLAGRCLAGPDAVDVDAIDYGVDASLATRFAAALSRYLPAILPSHLSPGQAGIRARLGPLGSGFHDFVVAPGGPHGAPRTTHLVGIESPGLTASLALASHVRRLAEAP